MCLSLNVVAVTLGRCLGLAQGAVDMAKNTTLPQWGGLVFLTARSAADAVKEHLRGMVPPNPFDYGDVDWGTVDRPVE